MPQRPRSHQLEDISLNRFRDAVPPAWVVRERSRDYGLDLEVEVFTDAGDATGLFFYVQVRATDDPKVARKLRFEVDQLGYFRLLDLPTAIVRYCASDDTFHLMWGFEVPSPDRPNDTLSAISPIRPPPRRLPAPPGRAADPAPGGGRWPAPDR